MFYIANEQALRSQSVISDKLKMGKLPHIFHAKYVLNPYQGNVLEQALDRRQPSTVSLDLTSRTHAGLRPLNPYRVWPEFGMLHLYMLALFFFFLFVFSFFFCPFSFQDFFRSLHRYIINSTTGNKILTTETSHSIVIINQFHDYHRRSQNNDDRIRKSSNNNDKRKFIQSSYGLLRYRPMVGLQILFSSCFLIELLFTQSGKGSCVEKVQNGVTQTRAGEKSKEKGTTCFSSCGNQLASCPQS